MRLRTQVAGMVCAPLLVLAGTGPAMAGEVNGPPSGEFATGGSTPIAGYVAHSICSFSGLNAFHPGKEGYYPGHTQSFGQIVKKYGKDSPDAISPGDACNGHSGELAGG